MTNIISGNAGLPGAIVALTLGTELTTTADGSGNYSFTGLAPGTYAVLAQLGGYVFSPNASVQTIVSSDITGVNFTAAPVTGLAGVWNKQGVVIGPQFASGPTVFYEGNAKILSGTVFKMWYTGSSGSSFVNGGLCYAESLDGISWTQYGSNPVVAFGSISSGNVFKNAGTYYGYYANTSFGSISQYTSPDGVTWTLAHSGVLSLGSAGAWDSSQLFNFQVVFIDGMGTWWAIYSGNAPSNNVFCTGVASSPDGVTWTKYASNPVIFNLSAGSVIQSGGTWYMYGDRCQYGRGGTLAYNFPTSCYRSSALSLTGPWSIPTPSLQPSMYFESDGGTLNGFDSPWLLEHSGKVFMYYCATTAGSGTGSNFQMGLAIANCTLAQLVSLPAEGVIGPGISIVQEVDNFTQAANATVPMVFPGSVTQGNLIVTFLTIFTASTSIPSDSMGNAYYQVGSTLAAGYGFLKVFVAVAKSTGANTVTWSTADFASGQAVELKGCLFNLYDQLVNATGSSGTLTASLYGQTRDFAIGFPIQGSGGVLTPVAPLLTLNGGVGPGNGGQAAYRFASANGNYSLSFTQAPSTNNWGLIAQTIQATLAPFTFGGGGDLGPSYDFRLRI